MVSRFFALMSLFALSTGALAEDAEPVLRAEVPRIKALAVKAITGKHPDISPEDLAFASIDYTVSADLSTRLAARYDVPGSAQTREKNINGQTLLATKLDAYVVILTEDGTVVSVRKTKLAKTGTKRPEK